MGSVNLSMAHPYFHTYTLPRHGATRRHRRSYPNASLPLLQPPECKYGLKNKLVFDKNDKGTAENAMELDHCRLHQCLRLDDKTKNEEHTTVASSSVHLIEAILNFPVMI